MTPFEIIICILLYLWIGVYMAEKAAADLSPKKQALTVVIWPVLIIILLFYGDWECDIT